MKSQHLTALRRKIWDDKFILRQPDSVLTDQVDQFAELIIQDCLQTFEEAERWAAKMGNPDKAIAIRDLADQFSNKYLPENKI